MRTYLYLLLTAVAGIILWAVYNESYTNGLVFLLGTLATGFCGYLIAEYFFSVEKKSIKDDIHIYKKEIEGLKEEKDVLQTQYNLATPHAEVKQLELQNVTLKEEKFILDELSRTQSGELNLLRGELYTLRNSIGSIQKKYIAYQEQTDAATDAAKNDYEKLNAELTLKKESVAALLAENADLQANITQLQADNTAFQTNITQLQADDEATQKETILQLTTDNNTAKDILTELHAENIAVKSNVTTLEATITQLKNDNISAQSVIAELNIDNITLLGDNTTLQANITQLNAENSTLKTTIAALKAAEQVDKKVENPPYERAVSPNLMFEMPKPKPRLITNGLSVDGVSDRIELTSRAFENGQNTDEQADISLIENSETPEYSPNNGEIMPSPVENTENTEGGLSDSTLTGRPIEAPTNEPKQPISRRLEPIIIKHSIETEGGAMAMETSQLVEVINEKTPQIQAITEPLQATDNLQTVVGIDAAIETLLKAAGIHDWRELSETSTERLTEIMTIGKKKDIDVSTWSVQAQLLADGFTNRFQRFVQNLGK